MPRASLCAARGWDARRYSRTRAGHRKRWPAGLYAVCVTDGARRFTRQARLRVRGAPDSQAVDATPIAACEASRNLRARWDTPAAPGRARAASTSHRMHQLRFVCAGGRSSGQGAAARARILLHAALRSVGRGRLGRRRRGTRYRGSGIGLPGRGAVGRGGRNRAPVGGRLKPPWPRTYPPGANPDPDQRRRRGLRVTHILYTVCGNNTTSSANGQDLITSTPPLASPRGRACAPRGPLYDVAVRRVRPLREHLDAGHRARRPGGPSADLRADAATAGGVDRAGDLREAVHAAASGGEI